MLAWTALSSATAHNKKYKTFHTWYCQVKSNNLPTLVSCNAANATATAARRVLRLNSKEASTADPIASIQQHCRQYHKHTRTEQSDPSAQQALQERNIQEKQVQIYKGWIPRMSKQSINAALVAWYPTFGIVQLANMCNLPCNQSVRQQH